MDQLTLYVGLTCGVCGSDVETLTAAYADVAIPGTRVAPSGDPETRREPVTQTAEYKCGAIDRWGHNTGKLPSPNRCPEAHNRALTLVEQLRHAKEDNEVLAEVLRAVDSLAELGAGQGDNPQAQTLARIRKLIKSGQAAQHRPPARLPCDP